MSQSLRVLIVEDSEYDTDLLLRALGRGGYEVASEVVDMPATMRAALERQDWDVITSDHAMPFFSAPAALALAKEIRPDVPFIIVSGEIDLNLAVSLVKEGAQDYIQKGQLARLVPTIERALREVEGRLARQRIEEALRVSETRYRRLFEAARDGILIVDEVTRKITDVNPFMTELLGYPRDEFLGKELWEIGLLKDMEASQNAFQDLQATGYIRYEDLPLQSRDGTRRDVEFVSNVYVEDGRRVIQCNIRDITLRKHTEHELYTLHTDMERRVQDRIVHLEVLNHELEMFNSSVSHDLHTPLRQIDDFVGALRDDYANTLGVGGLQLLDGIRVSAQRMSRLIEGLLALARVSYHEIKWEWVDLSALAHLVTAELQRGYPTRQVECAIAEGLTAQGDGRLLRIVLDNLLSNAWKFTAPRLTARIAFGSAPQANGILAYWVRDNGAGFDMAYVDKLFQPFQRLHRAKEFPGTGIGLATVQRIIHHHGGRVWAEGAVDMGATFYFTLPNVRPVPSSPSGRSSIL